MSGRAPVNLRALPVVAAVAPAPALPAELATRVNGWHYAAPTMTFEVILRSGPKAASHTIQA